MVLAWAGKSNKAIGRFTRGVGLFPAIFAALCGGLVIAVAADGFLRWVTPVDTAKPAAQIDVTRIALTVVAGVGGVVALVIAYRRQRDIEQGRFVERFGAAAAQLGATDVAVRIAGVYAMAGVADESADRRRQQCIEVLCGYLRLPYSPELGSNHQSKLVLKHHRATADGTRADDSERHLEYRHNDREVRATIVRVIADHLRLNAEYSWSTSDFDFRTAHLEDVDFRAVRFSGAARFDGTTFAGLARFDGATFAGSADFLWATFSGSAYFGETTFSGEAWFGHTTFCDTADFEGAAFSDSAWFEGATFCATTDFMGAAFSKTTWFADTTFSDSATFAGATFSDFTDFGGATFTGSANFGGATFTNSIGYKGTTFCGSVDFGGATFSSRATFVSATFSGDTRFGGATFSRTTDFGGATFSGDTDFDHTVFSGTTTFGGVTFSGTADFKGADFGAAVVSFVNPLQWGPPAPTFDWDQDVGQKPGNVEPQDWPPKV
ncbi:pentapeptide repeat-containing protein [Nocardia sp. NPDC059240]|uniref:pentapeptide repeat-containing protein n=1 Tax=Nocardia sp. NPDC059240 TaxID=3346786 RepID=UPI0036A59885